MKLKSIREIKNLKNKKVLLRVDFNVPLKNGRIAEDSRIKAAVPTIKYLVKKGASVIILSHLGRPKGKSVPELSNKILAERLSRLLKIKVGFSPEVSGIKVKPAVKNLRAKEVLMLENVRFSAGEKNNSKQLAKSWSNGIDFYVNDAFAVSHRLEASVAAITRYLPSYAGLLMEAEVKNLSKVLETSIGPKVAIIGGTKLETKVGVVKNLLKKMDYVLLGGGVANNFFKALGYEVGKSLVDDSLLKVTEGLFDDKLRLPIDVGVAKKISVSAKRENKIIGRLKKSDIILDIGPATVKVYASVIKKARLIVWNGPLGYFEIAKFKTGSREILKVLSKSKSFKVIGGGETVQLIHHSSFIIRNSFISTGGGAMLEFLEGKILPGIKPLIKK
jgi:phosphoglycerate kinase